jgi:two-component system LytT family response regulator/two-component system response regulator LytT
MNITALIVDDESLARKELNYLIDSAGGVDVLAEGSNGIEAVELIERLHPDLVFLDVQMPGLDGFAVLKRLLERHSVEQMPQIIFATAFDQYAVRAFDVNAIDYLLKPFDGTRVQQAIKRAKARLQGNPSDKDDMANLPDPRLDALLRLLATQTGQEAPRPSRIVVQAQNRLLLVDQKDICFAAIDDGTIRVVTQSFEGLSKCRTLEELLELLDPAIFWRAHRGFVVNINHIREVVPWFKSSYQLRMSDKQHTEIPVSRAQTRRLRELFKL